jgi:hypothetical protein
MFALRLSSNALVNSASVAHGPQDAGTPAPALWSSGPEVSPGSSHPFLFTWGPLLRRRRGVHDLFPHQPRSSRLGKRDVFGNLRHRPAARRGLEGPLLLREAGDRAEEIVVCVLELLQRRFTLLGTERDWRGLSRGLLACRRPVPDKTSREAESSPSSSIA